MVVVDGEKNFRTKRNQCMNPEIKLKIILVSRTKGLEPIYDEASRGNDNDTIDTS